MVRSQVASWPCGLKYGRTAQEDEKSGPETYALAEKLYGLFEQQMGSPTCYDIIQTDLRDHEARKRWVDRGGPQRCRELMKKTSRMVKQIIEAN